MTYFDLNSDLHAFIHIVRRFILVFMVSLTIVNNVTIDDACSSAHTVHIFKSIGEHPLSRLLRDKTRPFGSRNVLKPHIRGLLKVVFSMGGDLAPSLGDGKFSYDFFR